MPSLSETLTAGTTRAVTAFWRWWIAELSALVPRSMFPRGPGWKMFAELTLDPAQTRLVRTIDGQSTAFVDPSPLAGLSDDSWSQLADLIAGAPLRLLLVAPDIYTLELSLPKAARARLDAAVMLQLENKAPLPLDRLSWRTSGVGTSETDVNLTVTLARRDRIHAIQQIFVDRGLEPLEIAARAGDSIVTFARRLGRRGLTWQSPALITILIFCSIPLTTGILAAALGHANDDASAALEQTGASRQVAIRIAHQAEQARIALKPLARLAPIAPLLDELATHLPETASAHELSQNEAGEVTLVLDEPDPDVVGPYLKDLNTLIAVTEGEHSAIDSGATRISYRGRRP